MTILTDHLRAQAATFPDEVAYRVVGGGQVTFAEWDRESNRLARSFVSLGLAKGDRVAISITSDEALRWMVAYSAIHKAAAVAVPTNTRLAEAELERIFVHCEAKMALCDQAQAPLIHDVAKRIGSRCALEHVVVAPDSAETGDAAWSWGNAAGSDDQTPIQVEVGPGDLADILYTSGTTGTPKGVAVRHGSAALIPGPPAPAYSGQVWLHASPLFTFAGIGFIYNPMQLGLCGIYMPHFDAGKWLEIVEKERAQFVFLVPSMAQLIVAHERFATTDLTSVQICAIGSAPLAPSTLRAMQEAMPEAAVSNSYGMTEAGAAYCSMPKGESLRRIGSVGKPMPPLEVRIVDERGVQVPPGHVGEITMRMPGREREYYRDEQATARTWRDGWLHSGDLGRLDEDGFLYIVGRIKDVIIRGGNNIHAADVEAVLHDHPDVLEAAVIGIPHAVLGEDVAAVVVLRPRSVATATDLREHCANALADYKVPRRIEIVEDLPKNATGKVLKDQLREMFTA